MKRNFLCYYPLQLAQMTFLLNWSLEVFPLYRSSKETLEKTDWMVSWQ